MSETLHLKSKTSMKIFENESKDRKPKPLFVLTSDPITLEHSYLDYLEKPNNIEYSEEHSFFNCLEKYSTDSLEYKKDNCESFESEINIHFAYQRLEDEPDIDFYFWHQLSEDNIEDDSIQSSKIVGSL